MHPGILVLAPLTNPMTDQAGIPNMRARRCKQAQMMYETAPLLEIVFGVLITSPVKEILGCLCPPIRHPPRAAQ
jgi:hypothetical protein